MWDYRAANLQPGHKISDAKLALLTKAAVAACGGKNNGLKSDPFIADPTGCNFDPAALTCKGADSDDCLTAEEVETAKAFYSGPLEQAPASRSIYGWLPGSEAGPFNWGFLETPANAPATPAFDGLFKWVFGADWNWRDFDFDRGHAQGRRRARAVAERRDDRRHERVQGARRQVGHLSRDGRTRWSSPSRP